MLDAWGEQVPHGWVTGDDEFGRHTQCRHALRDRGERSVLGVPCTTMMRDLAVPRPEYSGRGRRPQAPWPSVTAWRKALHPTAWRRLTVRDGVVSAIQAAIDASAVGPGKITVSTDGVGNGTVTMSALDEARPVS